jgi:hypothetical protein
MADREEYLLVWSEDRGAGPRLFAKRVRANGLPVGGAGGGAWELTGPTGPGGVKGEQRWPALADGLVVWSERLPGGTDFDLYAQRLFTNSRASGAAKLVAGGPGDQRYAAVTGLGGDWLFVWSEDTNDLGDVMGRRVNNALFPRSEAFPIAQGPGVAEDPAITPDLSEPGAFLVVWTDDRNGNRDLFGTRVSANGLPRGGPQLGHFALTDSPEDDYAPAVLAGSGADRRFGSDRHSLLTWTHDDPANGPDVVARRLAANGLPRGGPFGLADGPGLQAWPAVAERGGTADDAPEWLVVWVSDATGTQDILGVEVGLNGLARRNVRVLSGD